MINVKFAPKDNGSSKVIHLYSDGGCRATAKKGETIKDTDKCAYAFFLKQGGNEKLDGWAGYGKTNNAMEIAGLLNGLKTIKNKNVPVVAYLDSAYVVNTIEKKWYEKWERDGWTKKGGLKNAELWKELINLIRQFPFFSIEKVRGHADDEYNNLVDKHLNELMDNLSDVPPVDVKYEETHKKSMLEEAMENNPQIGNVSNIFEKPRKEVSYAPIVEIRAQKAFSKAQLGVTLPNIVKEIVETDLSRSLVSEMMKYINISETCFGDNKIFSTEIRIVNDKARTSFKEEKNNKKIDMLLDMLLRDKSLNPTQRNILKEIKKEIGNG